MWRYWGWLLLVMSLAPGVWAQATPTAAPESAPLPVAIAPADPRLYLIGRFDLTDPAGPKCQWPCSEIRIRFRGTDLQAKVWTDEKTYLQLEVDGKLAAVLHPGKGEHLLDLATDFRDGEHEVALVKRTEWHTGVVQLRGVRLSAGGELLEPKRLQRFIELIGDTVVSGYGNESSGPDADYLPERHNATMSFGAIAGRELKAEVRCISMGSYKDLLPCYSRVLMFQPEIRWQFVPQPDAVVIMASIFGFSSPERTAASMHELKRLTQLVRDRNPQAAIYLATNPVVSNDSPPGGACYTKMLEAMRTVEAEMTAAGDAGIRCLEFETQTPQQDGIGGGYNPSVKTHQRMAKKLADTLREDLNWQEDPVAPEQ